MISRHIWWYVSNFSKTNFNTVVMKFRNISRYTHNKFMHEYRRKSGYNSAHVIAIPLDYCLIIVIRINRFTM